jgi:beta-D-xylosidase 4
MVVVQLGDQTDDTALLQNANVSAVVWAGFPGQSGGTAVFDILTGRRSPAGRLPVTQYPAGYVDAVSLLDMGLRPSAKNPGRTYAWYNGSVLPFGHGLHYTRFEARIRRESLNATYAIADLKTSCAAANISHPDLCPFTTVRFQVDNTGNATSDYVALFFLAGEFGPKPYPIKTLAAYRRLRGLSPLTLATTSMPVTLGSLARVDEMGNTVLYPGTYRLLLDVPTQDVANFTLTGEPWVLDEFPQPRVNGSASQHQA